MLGNIVNINYFSVRVRDGGGMGFPAVRMGGCCPLFSALSRLGWRLRHWAAVARRRGWAPSSLPSTCVLSILILPDIVCLASDERQTLNFPL